MALRTLFPIALLVCVSVKLVSPAEARARDDVISGAIRCAMIGDSRVWLDCYYGAAQPLRAQLNLSPVPAGQVRLATTPPGGNVDAGDVAIRDKVLGDASRCYPIVDDRQWLDCYYGAAQAMRIFIGIAPAPRSSAPLSAVGRGLANPARADLAQGLVTDPAAPRSDEHVVSRMASYSINRYHNFTITLSNGQVWRQLSGDTDYARLTKQAESYTVIITRGTFGSHDLQIRGVRGLFRVELVSG